MNNTTGDLFEFKNGTEVTSQHEPYNIKVHDAILLALMVEVGWVLFANTAIVVCFITNRNKPWPTFVVQIFCLSLSDLFVGLVTLPWIIIPIVKSEDSPIFYVYCSMMLYLLLCSQCGSLYYMLTICATRCFRIETSTRIAEPQNNRKVSICFALSAWIVSFFVCTLPFVFWTNTEVTMYSCTLEEIFVDKKKAMGLISILLFLPQALTNVLYLIACLRLRCIWRRVFPVQSNTSSGQNSNTTNIAPSGYSRANIQIQRRFMGTIGIVMLLFNICTLPVICLAFFENKNNAVERNFRYAACTFFILNSALNPFIYAFRSPWLKNALSRLLRNVCDCLVYL